MYLIISSNGVCLHYTLIWNEIESLIAILWPFVAILWPFVAIFLPSHCGFLEYWNSQKILRSIWKHFSCRLDEGIVKMWKKNFKKSRWLLEIIHIIHFEMHKKSDNLKYNTVACWLAGSLGWTTQRPSVWLCLMFQVLFFL